MRQVIATLGLRKSINIMATFSDTICTHCEKALYGENNQPCPYCGKTGRQMNVFVNESIALSDDHVMKSTCGATNRSAIHSDSKNPTETTLLQEHIKHFVENNHDGLNNFFKRLVSDFATSLILESIIFFVV